MLFGGTIQIRENGMIVVDALVKEYTGPKKQVTRAVDGVSFTAHQGEIFGLLGPNGAFFFLVYLPFPTPFCFVCGA